VCANGLDDDADTAIDWPDDIGCTAASGASEDAPCGAGVAVVDITPTGSAAGTTQGAPDSLIPSCAGFAMGGERVYAYRLGARARRLSARLAQAFAGSVVHLRRGDCREPLSEVACAYGDRLAIAPAEAGTYFVIVDSDFGAGPFALEIEVALEPGAACDPENPRVRCGDGLICRGEAGQPTSCQRPRCGNGADDDQDSRVDFPAEAGCVTASDDDEIDPIPAAACANGVDDDSDGAVDYPADDGCLGAGWSSELALCGDGVLVPDITASGSASGSTIGIMNRGGGNLTGERVYLFRLVTTANLRFSTDHPGTDFDTVLYVKRDHCQAAAEVGCNDDGGGSGGASTLLLTNQPPGAYFVFVDGYGSSAGSFVLTVSQP
jgi:hypothetical protein